MFEWIFDKSRVKRTLAAAKWAFILLSLYSGVDTVTITSSTCIGSVAPAADVLAPSFLFVPGNASLFHMVFNDQYWIALENFFSNHKRSLYFDLSF